MGRPDGSPGAAEAAQAALIALPHLQRAARMRPTDIAVLNNLGQVCFSLGRFAEALDVFRRAIVLQPAQSVLRQNEAMALQSLGRLGEAEIAFRAAIDLDPRALPSYRSLAQLLLLSGRPDEAVPLLRRAFELEPGSSRGLLQLAQALVEENSSAEAEKCVRQAIGIDPGNGAAHELLGRLLKQLGRFDEARSAFREAMRLQPGRKGLYLDVVGCGRITAAERTTIDEMNEALKGAGLTDEDRGRLHFGLAKAYEDLQDHERAMHHFDEAHALAIRELRARNKAFDARECVARFDEIIGTFTAPRLRDVANGSESKQPLFVVGLVRSGTTLVEQILTSHPQIAAGGELSFWPQNWRAVWPTDGGFDANAIAVIATKYLHLLNSIGEGCPHVTDKMPGNFIALGAIRAVFPHARVIACRRDPLDNCLSIYTTAFRSAHNWIHSREDILCFHKQHQRLMEHWRSVLSSDYLQEVDYEDLVSDSEGTARRMIEFVGLDWDPACLRPEQNDRAVRTPSQWQVRQPVYATSVGRWRNYEPWLGAFRGLIPGEPS